jgi:hypothetical protein
MSAEAEKSHLEQIKNALNQLKEMHHYSKANVEKLTALWMQFDGDMPKSELTAGVETMMTRQGEFYESLTNGIADLEATINRIEQAAAE